MYRLNWKVPLLLYLATFFSTTFCRFGFDDDVLFRFLISLFLSVGDAGTARNAWLEFREVLRQALLFSVPLMLILTCHEFGHYIQSRCYRVRSSLPYFIPIPFGILGTLGAVIAMDERIPNSKALFDIGITGPIAGLIPTLVFLYWGVQWSYIGPPSGDAMEWIGFPLLLQWTTQWFYGELPNDLILHLHPVALSAWAGLLLTSLNLMPLGQLDGGHIFHSLTGQYSAPIAKCGFIVALFLVVLFGLWHWSLLLILIAVIGVSHPPTANDKMPLTWFRRCLGWAMLGFVIIGLAPTPLDPKPDNPNVSSLYCVNEFTVQSSFFEMTGKAL
jgi:Zn-dependent protease